jgi:hypothetical protein
MPEGHINIVSARLIIERFKTRAAEPLTPVIDFSLSKVTDHKSKPRVNPVTGT